MGDGHIRSDVVADKQEHDTSLTSQMAGGLKQFSEDVAERNIEADNDRNSTRSHPTLASANESHLRRLATNRHSSGQFYLSTLTGVWYND